MQDLRSCGPATEKEKKNLVDVSDSFYFFGRGRGRGSPGRQGREGGGRFLLKIPRRGGVSHEGGGGRGPGGVRRELGGGGNIFCSGPKCPPRKEQNPENTKKQSPHPDWPPEIRKKYRKNANLSFNFIECFRGRHREGRNVTSFSRFSGPFFTCSEMDLFSLKTCTPWRQPPWSTPW